MSVRRVLFERHLRGTFKKVAPSEKEKSRPFGEGNPNGTKTSVTNSSTIVKSVYSNIPEALRDPSTMDFKFVSGGPVTIFGRDWDTQKDGAVLYPSGRYYHKGPSFWGRGSSDDGLSSSNTTGNYDSKIGGTLEANDAAASRVASSADALQHLSGMARNWSNNDEWYALGDESMARKAFYNATNAVDAINLRKGFGGNTLNSKERSMMVNFITDGYLPMESYRQYEKGLSKSVKLQTLAGFLNVANHGVQALGQAGMLRDKTINQVKELLVEYESLGGEANKFSGMNKYLKESKRK